MTPNSTHAFALALVASLCLVACGDDSGSTPDASVSDASVDAASDATEDATPDATSTPDADRPGLDASFGSRPDADVAHPMDDVLRLNHLQAEGTHNSYHVAPDTDFPGADYTMPTLTEQLDTLGVRKLELDLQWDRFVGRWYVYHAGVVDEISSCDLLLDCFAEVRVWSDAHPGHHPIFIQLEPKTPLRESNIDEQIAELEANISEVFPPELVVSPALVRGDADNVAAALAADGWPTLGQVRGRVLFFIDCGREWCLRYANSGAGLEARQAFPDSEVGDPFAGFMVLNSPGDAVRDAVMGGYLVRTRGTGLEDARAGDLSAWEAALASGGHVISTDAPGPRDDISVFVEVPGGTPSRCNPLTAPPECTSESIEDPALIAP